MKPFLVMAISAARVPGEAGEPGSQHGLGGTAFERLTSVIPPGVRSSAMWAGVRISGQDHRVGLRFYDDAGLVVGEDSVRVPDAGGGPVRRDITVSAPAGTTVTRFFVTTTDGSVVSDCVSLTVVASELRGIARIDGAPARQVRAELTGEVGSTGTGDRHIFGYLPGGTYRVCFDVLAPLRRAGGDTSGSVNRADRAVDFRVSTSAVN